MSIFTLESIEAIICEQSIDKIYVNGKCQFDEFEEEILKNKKYRNELGMIYRYIELSSEIGSLPPKNHFEDITPQREKVKEYEFKTKHLRVYAIKKPNGKIIILGGYKNRQAKDLNKFRSIKRRYLDQK